jgi:hypothetical protein
MMNQNKFDHLQLVAFEKVAVCQEVQWKCSALVEGFYRYLGFSGLPSNGDLLISDILVLDCDSLLDTEREMAQRLGCYGQFDPFWPLEEEWISKNWSRLRKAYPNFRPKISDSILGKSEAKMMDLILAESSKSFSEKTNFD